MNLGFMVAGCLAASLIAPAYAISLKLSPEVDLLVVDGRQVSGPILKGADSLQLNAGEHQILFQVSKHLRTAPSNDMFYHSVPMIVAFNATNLHAVIISLPKLTTEQESRDFNQKMNFRLIDENGSPVSYQQDTLSAVAPQNLEAAMSQYNLAGKNASVPAFALTQKSSAPLNASNNSSAQPEKTDKSSVRLPFPLWAILHQNPQADSIKKWFTAQ